jgi:hypothetical protein
MVEEGYLVVVAADPEVARLRQAYSPILFVGEWPAEVLNDGGESGRVIAIVPATVPATDLARTPVFYSLLHALPESLGREEARGVLARATRSGWRVSSSPVLAPPRVFADRWELSLRASELIEIYSPGEVDLVSGLRAPPLFASAAEREWARRRKPLERVRSGSADTEPAAPTPRSFGASAIRTELAGRSLTMFPFFEFPRAFNAGTGVSVAVDPSAQPQLVGQTVSLYVVAAKSEPEWSADPSLVDATGTVEQVSISAGSIIGNRFLVDSGTLSADAGLGLGVGYDVVVDADQNGQLSSGDLIDGLSETPGMFVVHDVTLPGPLAVTEVLYSGGTFLGQNLFYPTAVAGMGELPLIVISHGNGHNYQWYDHIGNHLASYGYVVMSHQNNTEPGIESASTTTLTNTDYFLANLDTIAGGVLAGHIDSSRIVWIGHSRGGEGIARAYDRIYDGAWTPAGYTLEDLRLLSSIAPTDFLGTDSAAPHGANYHLWVGGADDDVTGCVESNITQSFHLLDRAESTRQSISLHGVGHGDFHNGGGSSVATGPCLVGRPDTHTIIRGYLLPLIEFTLDGQLAGEDFLWRQWERFKPIGAPTSSCVVADLYYRRRQGNTFVLDDFQSEPSTGTSSSGGSVTFDVTDLTEDRLDDGNTSFTHNVGDPMNGMTLGSGSDSTAGIVFSYESGGEQSIEFEVPPGHRDFRGIDYLSIRAAQATRHPLTISNLGDQNFSLGLKDGSGITSLIRIGAYGGGLEEPYQRTSCGSGTGWNNEFETILIPVAAYAADGRPIDLADISTVVLRFGPGHGTAEGRLGLDEVELIARDLRAIFSDGFESGDTSAWSNTVP